MGAGRNRNSLAAAGWRLLINPYDPRDPSGFRYCLDNGAWIAFQRGIPFDEDRFEAALERYGAGADFVVLPDIVAGGVASLNLSMRWSNRCSAACDRLLIAVQDGMEPDDLRGYVGASVGIFLGGSTEWKLARMNDWGVFCAEVGCWYHVARVNTARRMRMAHAAGATSIDGSSASRFASTLPLLQGARSQPDLLSPRRIAA